MGARSAANPGMFCGVGCFTHTRKVAEMEVAVILPDWLWLLALFGLVSFGGICGSALLWCLHGKPLEEKQRETEQRLRIVEKSHLATSAVYRIHYKILTRKITTIRRESPTVRPPAA